MKRYELDKLLHAPELLVPGQKPLGNVVLDQDNEFFDYLAGYWVINQGRGVAYDYVNGNHGVLIGDAVWQVDANGLHIELDGTGDGIDCGTESRTDIDTSDDLLSIISTIRTSDIDSTIMAKRDGGVIEFQFYIDGGLLTFRSAGIVYPGVATVSDGNFHMVGMARDHGANLITTYLDDGVDGTSTSTKNPRQNINLSIGNRWNAYPATAFELTGGIYTAAIWPGRYIDDDAYLRYYRDQFQLLRPAASGSWVPVSPAVGHNLTVNDAESAAFAETPSLTQDHQASINNAESVSFADVVTLTQDHQFNVNNAIAQAEAEAVAYAQEHGLTALPAYSDAFAESVGLTQDHQASVNNAESAAFAEQIIISTTLEYNLNVQHAYSGAFADAINLTQDHQLPINNAESAAFAEQIIISTGLVYNLSVQPAYSVAFAVSVSFSQVQLLNITETVSNAFAENVLFFIPTLGEIVDPQLVDVTPQYTFADLTPSYNFNEKTPGRSVTDL